MTTYEIKDEVIFYTEDGIVSCGEVMLIEYSKKEVRYILKCKDNTKINNEKSILRKKTSDEEFNKIKKEFYLFAIEKRRLHQKFISDMDKELEELVEKYRTNKGKEIE